MCSPKGRTPLSCAAEAGNDDIVGFLLSCTVTTSEGRILSTSPEGSGVPEVRDRGKSATLFLHKPQMYDACLIKVQL